MALIEMLGYRRYPGRAPARGQALRCVGQRDQLLRFFDLPLAADLNFRSVTSKRSMMFEVSSGCTTKIVRPIDSRPEVLSGKGA